MSRAVDMTEIAAKWALFLFPVGIVAVRHWASGFFVVLALLGLLSLRRSLSIAKLQKEEKVVFLLFALVFVSFILSGTVNGWESYHVRYIEDEIRFLLFIPIYLLVKRLDDGVKYLVQGSVLGIVVTFGVAFYESAVLGIGRATGAYSPLLLGPVVVTMAFVVVNNLRLITGSTFWYYLSLLSLPLAGYAAYLSVSRSAYVLIVLLSIITIFIQVRGQRARGIWVVLLTVALLLSYEFAPHVTHSVDRVVAGVSDVIDADSLSVMDTGGAGSSTKQRIVMWHAAYQIFSDNMMLGIGRGGYPYVIDGYVGSGRVNPVVANHGHPHNIFFETLLSKGGVGLVVLLSLFVYLFSWAYRSISLEVYAAKGMMVVLGALFIAGMFEASLVIKGNYISFNVAYLAVFLSAMIQDKRGNRIG